MPCFQSLYRGESWCWFWYLILLAPRGCQSLAWWFDLLRSGLSRSFGSFGQDNIRGLRDVFSRSVSWLLVVWLLIVVFIFCCCWFHGLLHWNCTAESEHLQPWKFDRGSCSQSSGNTYLWKFPMEQKSRILTRFDFRSVRAYLFANALCSPYMSVFSISLSQQLINEFYSIECALLYTYTRIYTLWWK